MPKPSVLTLVGKSFAKKGFRFYFEGKNPSCTEDCRFFQTCQLNLVPHTVYEVIEIIKTNPTTPKTHTCPKNLHEEEMVLVRVAIPDLVVAIPNKEVFVGSTYQYHNIRCDHNECPNYELCVPELTIQNNDKIILKESLGRISDCARGENLTKMRVEKK